MPSIEHCWLSPCCVPACRCCLHSVRVGLSYKPAPAKRGELLALPGALTLLLRVQALEELRCLAWARLRRPPALQLTLGPGAPAREALCCCSSQCPGRAGTFWRSWPFCLDDNRSSRPAPCSAFDDQMRSYSRGYRSVFSPNESCVTMARSELQHMTQWVKQLGAAVKGRLGNRAQSTKRPDRVKLSSRPRQTGKCVPWLPCCDRRGLEPWQAAALIL